MRRFLIKMFGNPFGLFCDEHHPCQWEEMKNPPMYMDLPYEDEHFVNYAQHHYKFEKCNTCGKIREVPGK